MKKKTIEERRVDFKKYGLFVIHEYKKNNKLHCKCIDEDGYLYSTVLSSLKRGEFPNKISKFNPYSIYNIKQFIKNKGLGCKLISNEYKTAKEKWEFKCSCGNCYESTWRNFVRMERYICPECSNRAVHNKQRLSYPLVANEFMEHGYTLLCDEYTDNYTRIPYMDKDGLKYKMTISHLRAGQSSAIVHKSNPYSIENIQTYANMNKLNCTVVSDEYVSKDYSIEFKCSCGTHYFSTWESFYVYGLDKCESCRKEKSSYEFKTEAWLNKNDIAYRFEKPFPNKDGKNMMSFDFYIVKNNIKYAIECDGIQHYKAVEHWGGEESLKNNQQRDAYKNKYCKDNKIILLRIPYWEFKDDTYKYRLEEFFNN